MGLIRKRGWSLLSIIATFTSLAIYRLPGAYPLSLKIIAGAAFVVSPVSAIVAMVKEKTPLYGAMAFVLSCFSFFLNVSG
jgi:hypothetical protein